MSLAKRKSSTPYTEDFIAPDPRVEIWESISKALVSIYIDSIMDTVVSTRMEVSWDKENPQHSLNLRKRVNSQQKWQREKYPWAYIKKMFNASMSPK